MSAVIISEFFISPKSISSIRKVSAAQKAFENSRETMGYAQMSYLEVLAAQNSFLEAQLQESADFLEFQQCLINLYKAMCYE